MAINFPTNQLNGATHTATNGKKYVYKLENYTFSIKLYGYQIEDSVQF